MIMAKKLSTRQRARKYWDRCLRRKAISPNLKIKLLSPMQHVGAALASYDVEEVIKYHKEVIAVLEKVKEEDEEA